MNQMSSLNVKIVYHIVKLVYLRYKRNRLDGSKRDREISHDKVNPASAGALANRYPTATVLAGYIFKTVYGVVLCSPSKDLLIVDIFDKHLVHGHEKFCGII
ncbi:hypothetical protein NQ317_018792 [Molorchus minor]|uniref:Uncharacterized protein n=1 Tax=Molorchus minor TaxID=1323400 RepID=A0ABQ9J5C9_9CUCU|nr:hypothetical protein NQ317_018792 [Molorchus minor]